MKRVFLIALIVFSVFLASCTSDKNKAQEVKFATDVTSSIGAVRNQTQIQEINWRVSLKNIGSKTAESVTASIILHPAVVSRLNGTYQSSVMLDDFRPGSNAGFNGSATFNATGLSKQDIAAWKPLFSIKITWLEDGNEKEQVTGIN